ncbi:phospho-sugar mutase [Bacteroidota bacterium]
MENKELFREVTEKAQTWLDSNIDQDSKDQILDMMENNKDEFVESFYRSLEFGTGGLRGIMGIGTNRMNIYTVGMATQGLSNYLKSCFSDLDEIKVAIAHDCRNNSRLFTETCAGIFAANGIRSYIFDSLRPTPELSFALRYFQCQSGVIITASHNPKEYNGYKVYWEDGGQIVAPHDKNIIEEVNKISSINEILFNGDPDLIDTIPGSFDDLYIDRLTELSLSPEAIMNQHDMKIVYTPIHGTGVKLVPMSLAKFGFTQVYNVPEQDEVNGDFPTVVSPNPEESAAMAMALDKAEQVGADLVMATDPDADRVGIAVRDLKGKLVLLNGNQTGALLYYYLLRKWSENGKISGKQYVVKTIVTTELLADIARKYGVEIFDVLTGFKFIAEIIRREEGNKEFIIGSEESYGYLAGDFVRDKDAVMSCALIAETAAWAKEQGKSLYELLLDIYLEFGFYHETLVSTYKTGKEGAELISKMMEDFRNSPPTELAGSAVSYVHDYLESTTVEKSSGKTSVIKLPKSNVLQYLTDDNSKVSIRPSGTEPKIKFYFSVKGTLSNRGKYAEAKKEMETKIDKIKEELGIE